MDTSDLLVFTPPHPCDPALAIAACRAGARGVLDVEFADEEPARSALEKLASFAPAGFGVKLPVGVGLSGTGDVRPACVILSGVSAAQVSEARRAGIEVLIEATSLPEALRAAELGTDGVILKGHEAGGRVGADTSFVLIQKWRQAGLMLPFWVRGGVGPNTAAACLAAGARGVVVG
jgi:NAD(P)H-dependent flavin oxidoreductase YrpB (nitropropane dioxygenase family)